MKKKNINCGIKWADKLAIALVCFAGATMLFYFSSQEYRLVIIAGFVTVSIIERGSLAAQVGLHILELFLAMTLPLLALLLWIFDHLPFAKMLTPMEGAQSRAELRQCWSDSWLTAPIRYFQSKRPS